MRYVKPGAALFIEHSLRGARALPGSTECVNGGQRSDGSGKCTGPGRACRGAPGGGNPRRTTYNMITARFFEIMRIPLRRGRNLQEHYTNGTPWVAIVNETFAREFFPNSHPLGRVIHLSEGRESRPRESVGVVADYAQFTPRMPVQSEAFTSHFHQRGKFRAIFEGRDSGPS